MKGRNETRLMSPLLYQLSYTATDVNAAAGFDCADSAEPIGIRTIASRLFG